LRLIIKKIVLLLVVLFVKQAKAQHSKDTIKISLNAITGLQFDLVRFTVKPEANVKINFFNTDDMSHNLLITKPGTRLKVVNDAIKLEEKGPAMNYIPRSHEVLWSIPVLSPGQGKSIRFKAPAKAGAYPYVCTYPGHGFLMYGVMYVTSDGKIPDGKTDPNIPPSRRQDKTIESKKVEGHAVHEKEAPKSAHPYTPKPPYLYRTFMEDASPAAIAVSLPHNLSYCWDAGVCKLRYAWAGGFVDNTAIWKGHADAVSKVVGTIFYRDKTEYPLRIGQPDQIPELEYKGYSLINEYPEFHYTLNGVDVFELIKAKEDGKGLIRNFRIPGSDKTVWFVTNDNDEAIKYEASTGSWEQGRLQISPQQARNFAITVTSYPLVYNKKQQ